MSEREPITAELRGKMDTLGWYDEDGNIVFTTGGTPVSEIACLAINSKAFERLCDAIDAVHAGLERENAELRQRVAVLDNERGNMHDGWIRLPLDADGVPIRVGDVVAYADNTKPMEVVALVPPAVFLTEEGPRYADMCRHHYAPTVEDVLREMADRCYADEDEPRDRDAIVAEFAAKLRLAGDAE